MNHSNISTGALAAGRRLSRSQIWSDGSPFVTKSLPPFPLSSGASYTAVSQPCRSGGETTPDENSEGYGVDGDISEAKGLSGVAEPPMHFCERRLNCVSAELLSPPIF